ncbi:hypothetical protein E1265_10375 [Streptomyces sp. 8K308]|uniref:hypothetical protein n=1 Tax=Streptomyces sp. 8K308 TaxID=2530388 RepID=UPI001042E0F6|nr:hypothetical protein [Streptomyces sp. 8K308]TDC24239.1 hypothetical protein E1265_10375 [Streptomyces sp. 8K308]
MTNGEVNGPVVCPGCRTWENVPVAEARVDKRGRSERLSTRLAIAPASGGDWFIHSVEGVLIAVVAGSAGAYYAEERDLPWLTAVGAVAAVLILVATFAIIRDEVRDDRRVRAGRPRAEALSAGARYCYQCRGVFYPGSGWPGVMTPEQFRHYVWTGAGYGGQLDGKAQQAGLS